jgi:hypothetical protein
MVGISSVAGSLDSQCSRLVYKTYYLNVGGAPSERG